ncbi:tRNA (adenosine(37)-N6)-dimethylallyltransferase MiaA [Pseudoglutamicibacter albus]|uniref:tRNA dimethylallyltransferase n=1 Tax=Pseudoglutamicibacter cumminsii TaxID=156979 RepID=A0AAP4FH44_9MICC|nr:MULTISPECIES: tRNA (adenosine(37)-N6)-dimethylallyltransferase MiaA [Pseudoglutamicibacter]MDK6275622.1 tRNA (adenosine(37)-N6)-dimethylallyltransferase MiaA [Pseudoglutamicibacter cumminsii]PKY79824.1 tRNA (adenosine(37)-N6)-dimethylallyltransferase MiaA [Pseudoglutamicibacter albus]WIK84696.1 tRNA (adenosine(37)-N6)-dimethylallyltransferase MiaA [Pseudoglutamicibacter albus]
MSRPVIAVVGPTGTGKSELALELCHMLDGEVVNTDALQFYRGMDIGTAKLPVAERQGIEHHLLDIMDVTEEASVAVFQEQARDAIAQIQERGKTAVLVGGSGLYVRAVLDEIEFPPTDPQVRAEIEEWADGRTIEEVRERLREVDPESAAKINDLRRMIRALEVHRISGRTFTSYMPQRIYHQPTLQVGLDLDPAILNDALLRRVHRMYQAGLLDEVRGLIPRGLREGRTASAAIGYKQALAVLDGEMSQDEGIESTHIATRQFAKRQRTWFRADPRVTHYDAGAGTREVARTFVAEALPDAR